jgi:hypothetical protein
MVATNSRINEHKGLEFSLKTVIGQVKSMRFLKPPYKKGPGIPVLENEDKWWMRVYRGSIN